MYKPWGAGSAMYALQHGSLFVTSFVFLMVSHHECFAALTGLFFQLTQKQRTAYIQWPVTREKRASPWHSRGGVMSSF